MESGRGTSSLFRHFKTMLKAAFEEKYLSKKKDEDQKKVANYHGGRKISQNIQVWQLLHNVIGSTAKCSIRTAFQWSRNNL